MGRSAAGQALYGTEVQQACNQAAKAFCERAYAGHQKYATTWHSPPKVPNCLVRETRVGCRAALRVNQLGDIQYTPGVLLDECLLDDAGVRGHSPRKKSGLFCTL